MPNQVNEFYKGIDADTDPMKTAPDSLRDAHNIRIINNKGQGFVITNIGGNEYEYSLSLGFIPLGSCQFNGIEYIFSINPITLSGEIGTYPSPLRGVNNSCNPTGGFDHTYKPLNNFTLAVNPLVNPNAQLYDFRTTLFDFDCEHQIECFARIDYDDSVNLYFTDNKNPYRTINSGFNQSGICNGRNYWNGSFPNGIEALSETCSAPIVDSIALDQSGCLRAGNWIFYARYNTLNFNPTSFLGESNAVEIFADALSAGIVIDGDISQLDCGKSITLNFSNIDTTYPYLEIGYSYHFDGTFETALVDFLFPINPNSTTLQIKITGCEDTVDIIADDIISRKTSDDIFKTITQLENRFWGANVKTRAKFHPDLLAFAKATIAKPNDSLSIFDKQFAVGDGAPPYGQYKDYQKTYKETGYFRSEAYALSMIFVFKSGRESEPLPLSSYDYWFDPTLLNINDQGIIRFPAPSADAGQSPLQQSQNSLSIMGIEFDMTACVFTQWMKNNVCGFYFMRGERNPNMMYQGMTLDTFNAVGLHNNMSLLSYGGMWPTCAGGLLIPGMTDVNHETLNRIPLFGGTAPFLGTCNPTIGASHTAVSEYHVPVVARQFGMYSPDHFFNKGLTDKQYTIYKMAQCTYSSTTLSSDHTPNRLYEVQAITPIAAQREQPICHNIKEWTVQPNPSGTGFVSYFEEPTDENNANSFYYRKKHEFALPGYFLWANRSFATTRYIGIDATATPTNIANYSEALISIFKEDPDPLNGFIYTDQYDVKNTKYFKISNFIDINTYTSVIPGAVFYRGDCFLQRTYIKQLQNPSVYSNTKQDDFNNYFSFGILMSVVTENSVNTAMRRQDASYSYYPATGLGNPNLFVTQNNSLESELYNKGYQQVLSLYAIFGYDSSIPYRGVHYPTRIKYSNLHTPNAFSDAYRTIDKAAYKDFDFRMGSINKILDLNAKLISIQDQGMNLHYVNDRAMLSQGNASAGQLLLGAGDILAQKAENITDFFGTQHQWSVVKTDNAAYGIDANKRKIWRLVVGQGLELISDTKHYRAKLYEILEQGPNSFHSDIIESIPDNPVCKGGIVGAFSRSNNDIIFAFMFDQTIQKPLNNYCIKFNESGDSFTGTYGHKSPFYMALNNDFFSFNPNIFPSQNIIPTGQGDFYREGVDVTTTGNDNRSTFYGVLEPMTFSFNVNAGSDFIKIFDHYYINSDPNTPDNVQYETVQQLCVQNPFLQPVISNYLRPAYKENQWMVPISRATAITNMTNNIYAVGSPMRGQFIKTTLEYMLNKPIFVKSVDTHFRLSSK